MITTSFQDKENSPMQINLPFEKSVSRMSLVNCKNDSQSKLVPLSISVPILILVTPDAQENEQPLQPIDENEVIPFIDEE